MYKRKVQVIIMASGTGSKQISKVLLLQTNKKRGGFWQNVTGSVERFERFPKAAIRELWEETGIEQEHVLKFVDLKLTHQFRSKKGNPVKEKSYVVVVKKCKIKIDPKEHQNYIWKSIKSVRSSNYRFPTNFESFCLAKKYLKI